MTSRITQFIDKMLLQSEKNYALKIIEKFFNIGIPFNQSHNFQYIELTDNKTLVKLPFIKANKNHLGGIHACAIATLGEYSAGLTLVKKYGNSKYRIVMKDLKVEFDKQAKENLYGEVIPSSDIFQQGEKELKETSKGLFKLHTKIKNEEDIVIANVYTTWQLKNWKQVTFKK